MGRGAYLDVISAHVGQVLAHHIVERSLGFDARALVLDRLTQPANLRRASALAHMHARLSRYAEPAHLVGALRRLDERALDRAPRVHRHRPLNLPLPPLPARALRFDLNERAQAERVL